MAKGTEITLSVNPARVTLILSFTALGLVVCNLVAVYLRDVLGYESAFTFIQKFYMDGEGNVPAFFSTFNLLFSSFLFGITANLKNNKKDTFSRHWLGLAIVFFVLAFDEGFQLHELISIPLNKLKLSGVLAFSWVLGGCFIVLLFVMAYIKFFFSLPLAYKYKFFLAAFIFISGTLGMEMVGGWYVQNYGRENIAYSLLFTIEETLEIAGIIILIHSLLNYLEDNLEKVTFMFNNKREAKIQEPVEKIIAEKVI